MKKNISINIGGIIFHIEEDGYDKLKNYLDNINAYFANFQDSQEIISDIENRIAEIFLQKLKEDKQVINSEDVAALMTTLGSIADFQEAEKINESVEEEYSSGTDDESQSSSERKLYRNTKRKIFGGVAAGIAHYFKIDPLWIRLILIIITLSTLSSGIGFVFLITYLILWIALPTDPFMKEPSNVKKLYRANEGVVIGGVAKGLAVYFGVDVAVIRLLFVLAIIPGGIGLFIYVVLWLITPKANSLTEKMQMEGTPITLANIEKSIKSNFNLKEGEESTLVKILLFPFRLISTLINALAKVLGPLLNLTVDIVRVILGIIFLSLGLLLGTSSIGILLFGQGWLLNDRILEKLDAPISVIINSISAEVSIISLLLLLIPAIFIAITGISLLSKKSVLNKTVGFTLLGIYIISLLAAGYLAINTALEFSEKATLTETFDYEINSDATLLLDVKEIGYDNYEEPNITLYGYEGNTIKLEKNTFSRGYSKEEALEKASMLLHEVNLINDSIILIDSDIRFQDSAVFRAQKLNMKMYIPYNQKFQMDYKMREILRNTIYRNGYTSSQIANNTWVFTPEGLKCLSCTEKPNENILTKAYQDKQINESFYNAPFRISENENVSYFDNTNFTEISVATGIFLEIQKGEEYSITAFSEEDDLDKLRIEQSGEYLKVYYEKDKWNWERAQIKIIIITPELNKLRASSAATVHLKDFNQKELNLDLSSSAKVYLAGDLEKIDANTSSASALFLSGKARKLNVNASSSSKIRALNMEINEIDANVSSAASANLYVIDYLKANASSAGRIKYTGNPEKNTTSSSGGRIVND